MKNFTTILITAVIAVTATWLLTRPKPLPSVTEKKPLYYQSAMHPWIKSDKPGRCTICGMELTPVYAGDTGFDAASGENIVNLTASQTRVIGIATTKVEMKPLVRSLQVAGMIDDDETRHRILSAYVPGRVEKLHVNHEGAEVTEGQPLADFYSPSLLQSEREYRQLTGDLKKNTGLRLRQMGLTQEQILALDEKPAETLSTQILAPMSGTVVARDIYEGQYVMEGAKLFEIADFSTMWFKFDAYEQDMPWLKTGQNVTINTPSQPGKNFKGTIRFIDPNFSEMTGSTKVRVELPNPPVEGRRELYHRAYASGTVTLETPEVLSVPRTAVMETGSNPVVYVDQGKAAYEQRTVILGRRGDDRIEILSGLKAGDYVVTSGTLLIDGQAELNRSFITVDDTALTENQKLAIREFVSMADSMSATLAADDLTAFNKASESLMITTDNLVKALGDRSGIPALGEARHFHGFDDMKKARSAFYQFSQAAAKVLGEFAGQPGVPDFQIWECPMANEAISIPTKTGRWIQTGGREGQNPYFGAGMLSCGKQIKGGMNHD